MSPPLDVEQLEQELTIMSSKKRMTRGQPQEMEDRETDNAYSLENFLKQVPINRSGLLKAVDEAGDRVYEQDNNVHRRDGEAAQTSADSRQLRGGQE